MRRLGGEGDGGNLILKGLKAEQVVHVRIRLSLHVWICKSVMRVEGALAVGLLTHMPTGAEAGGRCVEALTRMGYK